MERGRVKGWRGREREKQGDMREGGRSEGERDREGGRTRKEI